MSTSNPRFSNMGAPNKLEGVAETVKEKAEGASTALSETAKTVKRTAQDAASTAAETAEKAWESTRHMAEDVGAEVSKRAETAYADTVFFIRRNPIASVLGAVGLGMLAGAILFAGARGRD